MVRVSQLVGQQTKVYTGQVVRCGFESHLSPNFIFYGVIKMKKEVLEWADDIVAFFQGEEIFYNQLRVGDLSAKASWDIAGLKMLLIFQRENFSLQLRFLRSKPDATRVLKALEDLGFDLSQAEIIKEGQ